MKVFILTLALTPLFINSAEYGVDVGVYRTEHAWRGVDNYAQFDMRSVGVGFSVQFEGGLYSRFGLVSGDKLTTKGRYTDVVLNLKYIASFELAYRMKLAKSSYLLVGLGTNVMPIPNITSTDEHHSSDYDNDEGYLIELQYEVTRNISIAWRFTHTSRIKSNKYDEWTKYHALKIIYMF